jgi:transcriptional regulator with XRE-family HTH domain
MVKRLRSLRGPKARISREYLWRLESGRQDPTLGTLEKLAKALKVKVTELLE